MTKRPLKKISLLICFGLLTLCCFAQDQDSKSWTQEKANQWMQTGDWKKDLHASAHPSVNAMEFAEQYHKNKMVWDKAFLFLGRKDLDTLSPGTYPIEGENVFAIINVYNPKDMEQTRWESHLKYTDLHYVIRGKEKIGVADVSQAKVTEPYDQTKDIAHYESDGKYYIAEPGIFFLFFPQDAHRPGIKTEGETSVKKLVIKIIVAK